jgi:hypothetical protein
VVNVLSLTNGSIKNVVTALATATSGATVLQITSSTAVIKVSSLLLANGGSGYATAAVQLVSSGTTFPVAIGVDVDPEQVPLSVVSRSNPMYLTGDQSIKAYASSTNVAVIVNYEELR